jgi:hypothetical protein
MPSVIESFNAAIQENDKVQLTAICEAVIQSLYQQRGAFSTREIENILGGLRSKRQYKLMIRICDTCIQTGLSSFRIRRQLAQILIEEGLLTAALAVLTELLTETAQSPAIEAGHENNEANGLMGRVYKQLYLLTDNPGLPHSIEYINKAVGYYLTTYEKDKTVNTWHGINTVALVARAQRDGIALSTQFDIEGAATSILQVVEKLEATESIRVFDYATALEASIALKDITRAISWAEKYIQHPKADAFELASTLRQLTNVWQLGKRFQLQRLIPLLRGALLRKEGGVLTIGVDEIQTGVFDKERMVNQPEKVFGTDDAKTYEWYMKGASRCLPVARIGKEASKGIGTGFLLDGQHLHASLQDELVLLTNAHVVSDDETDREALRPEESMVTFEVLGIQEPFTIASLFYTSPFKELDVSVLRFSQADNERLRHKLEEKKIDLFPISQKRFNPNGEERLYIIGHPAGGILQLSLQDNELLDYEGRLLHYRTPTTGGSSGSPVFDDDWKLVGIHHSGNDNMRKLNNKAGSYQANEGIRINHIIEAVSKE